MTTRETDSDTAEAVLGAHTSGQQAFWAGEAFDPAQREHWRMGWMAAAAEAQRQLTENLGYLKARLDIRDVLNEANAAIRALMPGKPRPRQTQLANSACALIEVALKTVEFPAAGAAPPRVVASASQPGRPARGGKRQAARR